MQNLLKIEWLKIKNYRAFWILSGLFLLSIFGINYITYSIQVASGKAGNILESLYAFPEVWSTTSFMSGFILFMPGLIIIMNIANEYSYRTNRQNIIDGMSRTQFISVKFSLAFILAVCSTLMVFLVTLLFGLLFSNSTLSFDGIKYIFYFFIQSCSYLTVAMVLVLWLKRSGIAIGIYFLYAFILDNMIGALLVKNVGQIGYYLPLEAADKLIGIPFIKNIGFNTKPSEFTLLFVAVAYIVAGVLFCKYKFEKDDL